MNDDHTSFLGWHRGKLLLLGLIILVLALGVVAAKVFQGGTAQSVSTSVAVPNGKQGHTKQSQVKERRPARSGQPPRRQSGSGRPVLPPDAEDSFARLESEHPGDELGLSVAAFGSGRPRQIGALGVGHAWSTLKVPIVATVMREKGSLEPAQDADASAAITASDNEAAARLFAGLGDIDDASAAVERTLAASGYPTHVAREPPPSGAVSTWGQTDWTLSASTGFYRALICGKLDLEPAQTARMIGLMEEVIPEQQWGLGTSGAAVPGAAIKGGWGPTDSESGPYLVRQAAILRAPKKDSGAVVTIAAVDASGSFEAGTEDLDAVAKWVRENVSVTAGTCGK